MVLHNLLFHNSLGSYVKRQGAEPIFKFQVPRRQDVCDEMRYTRISLIRFQYNDVYETNALWNPQFRTTEIEFIKDSENRLISYNPPTFGELRRREIGSLDALPSWVEIVVSDGGSSSFFPDSFVSEGNIVIPLSSLFPDKYKPANVFRNILNYKTSTVHAIEEGGYEGHISCESNLLGHSFRIRNQQLTVLTFKIRLLDHCFRPLTRMSASQLTIDVT